MYFYLLLINHPYLQQVDSFGGPKDSVSAANVGRAICRRLSYG